ncbi:Lon protease [Arthrobacter ulcerisalmonis]|uniref:endopeptidase La n=2 Tax=Arthrobacter ulcerisalmonis TaxID=2483813 RepID=A0A3P5WVV8_9MICC|nr:Lon protease [Arthrobacter ulcerisalmonis]
MTTTSGGRPADDRATEQINSGATDPGDTPTAEVPSTAAAGGSDGGRSASSAPGGAPRDRKASALMIAGLTALGLGIAVATIPVPYVVESPGPTYNTLGESQGHPVIKVSGHETYPAAGNLDLTTVYVDGGPNGPVSILGAFSSWLDRTKSVYPEELIYPTGTSREEAQEQSSVAMTTSQENAIASALNELKIPYGQKLQAVDLSPGAAAEGRIEPDDVLVSINGTPITSLAVIQADLAAGNGAPVEVVVERDGQQLTQTMTPKDNGEGRFILGVVLKALFTFPFDVQISLDKVGGPSAGMMFALGIIDTVTPGDLTGGVHVAGTGTITPDGQVGPIGGIGQKMVGAQKAGATLFLAPAENCDEVVGHVPDGLQVVKVENLAGARAAVELAGSGKDTSALPTCTNN